jgi:hypothetical protein
VLLDGPDGFRSGPHRVTWVRSFYPSGKHCSLLHVDGQSGQLTGLSMTTLEDSLVIEEFALRPMPPTT